MDSDSDSDSFEMPSCSRCSTVLTEAELVHFKHNRGRCAICQDLWVTKAICPVCEVQWDDSDVDMVGCDGCDFWVHSRCDRVAARVVAESGEQADYFCPPCRDRQERREKRAALATSSGARQKEVASPRSAAAVTERRPVGRPPKRPVGRPPLSGRGPGRPPSSGRGMGRPPGSGRGRPVSPPRGSRAPGRPPGSSSSGRPSSPPPPKRPPGRPPGSSSSRPSSPPPVKRPPGRPPGSGSGRPVGRPPLLKRPPGRPPKSSVAEPREQLRSPRQESPIRSAQAYPLPDPNKPIKRGPGRPPKNRAINGPNGPRARAREEAARAPQSRAAPPQGGSGSGPLKPRTAYALFRQDLKRHLRQEGHMLSPTELEQHAKEQYRVLPEYQRKVFEVRAAEERRAFGIAPPDRGSAQSDSPPVKMKKKVGRPPKVKTLEAQQHGGERPSGGATKRPAYDQDQQEPPAKRLAVIAPGSLVPKGELQAEVTAAPRPLLVDLSKSIDVICNGFTGTFVLSSMHVICTSICCRDKSQPVFFTPTHFEAHAGCGAAKKWKASLRIPPGGAPGVPATAPGPLMMGKWLEQNGVETKGSKSGPGARAVLTPVKKEPPPPPPPPPPPVWEPWNDVKNGNYAPVPATWAGDRCGVCGQDVDCEADQLVSCDMCGATVHQSCYGIRELPAVDDIWLCRACETREAGEPPQQCIVCPVQGGPLKPTEAAMGGGWCHVSCMWWIAMLRARSDVTMEPVEGFMEIEKARWELKCVICKQVVGAKVQCSHPKCYAAFHPTCGQMAGTHMEMVETDGGMEHITFCPRHCNPQPEFACVQLKTDGGAGAGAGGSAKGTDGAKALEKHSGAGASLQLWNRQPYKQLPGLGIPECTAGCARAQPLSGEWERQNHGTGAGYTSLKGFWMPELSKFTAPASNGMALSQGPGRRGRPSAADKAIAKAANDEPSPPPEETDLTDLPEGLPESITITCNSNHAVFFVRTQYVEYKETTMTASKFEQVCGKGDAKKWKSSIWVTGSSGEPVCSMQEWLNQRSLDRKALQALQANAQAHEAWNDYLEEQKEPKKEPKKEGGAEAAEGANEDVDAGEEKVKAEPGADAGSTGRAEDGAEPSAEADGNARATAGAASEGAGAEDGPKAACNGNHEGVVVEEEEEAAAAVDNGGAAGALRLLKGAEEGLRKGTPEEAKAAERVSDGDEEVEEVAGANGGKGGVSVQEVASVAARGDEEDTAMEEVKDEEGDFEGDKADGASMMETDEEGMMTNEEEPREAAAEEEQEEEMAGEDDEDRLREGSVEEEEEEPQGEPQRPPDLEGSPEEAVGCFLRLYWPDDDEWYEAEVVGYDAETTKHEVYYPLDQENEWISLRNEELGHRVQWLPGPDSASWPSAPPAPAGQCRYFPPEEEEEEQEPRDEEEPDEQEEEEQEEDEGASTAGEEDQEDASDNSDSQGEGGSGSGLVEAAALVAMRRDPEAATSAAAGAGAAGSPQSSSLPPPAAALSSPGPDAEGDPESAIGWRLGVWWPGDRCFYYGIVEQFDAEESKHLVHYDDGECEWLPVTASDGTIQWLEADGYETSRKAREREEEQLQQQPPPDAGGEPAAEGAAPAEGAAGEAPAAEKPEKVNIICASLRGVFNVAATMVMMENGSSVTPTEFERLAGKSSSKKWKASIRIMRPGGLLGQTIGDWLADQGVSGAKPSSNRTAGGGGGGGGGGSALRLAALRARQLQMAGNRAKGGVTVGRSDHRPGCMCVLCKQARAKAQHSGGSFPGRYRAGKGAYVQATPMMVTAGPVRNQLCGLPASRCWSPGEWEAAGRAGEGPSCGLSDGEDEPSGDEPIPHAMLEVTEPEPTKEEPADVKEEPSTAASTQLLGALSEAPEVIKAEAADAAENGGGGAEGSSSWARDVLKQGGGMSQVERLKQCQATERERLTFGKSGIHGWGLFAKKPMKSGSMVIEYRGEILPGTAMAEQREDMYHREGKDCYLFTVNENHVVDATMQGTIGRFTNHSCQPSMYTKILEFQEGDKKVPHLVFFTRTDIIPGQELTYDYRFKEEDGERKMHCKCGAPNCRGTMN